MTTTTFPDFLPNVLETETPHERDSFIRFTEEDHMYYVQFSPEEGFTSEGLTSTSTFIHEFFSHFDPDLVLLKMRRSPKFIHGKYAGMTNLEIKKMWDDSGKAASERGTLLHFLLECHNNGYHLSTSPYSKIEEITDYFRWRNLHFQGLIPFRTEMRMYTGSDLKLTGTADLLAIDENHLPPSECDGILSLHLIDWKFSKAIHFDNAYEQGHGVCHNLPNCNFSAYSLQQNIYQWMMETYYPNWTWKGHVYTSVRIVSKHLAIFHRNHSREGYYLSLPDLQDLVQSMVDVRRENILKQVQSVNDLVIEDAIKDMEREWGPKQHDEAEIVPLSYVPALETVKRSVRI
jgi:hypothetical protein